MSCAPSEAVHVSFSGGCGKSTGDRPTGTSDGEMAGSWARQQEPNPPEEGTLRAGSSGLLLPGGRLSPLQPAGSNSMFTSGSLKTSLLHVHTSGGLRAPVVQSGRFGDLT